MKQQVSNESRRIAVQPSDCVVRPSKQAHNVPVSELPLDRAVFRAPRRGAIRVAMNAKQWSHGMSCGVCLEVTGMGFTKALAVTEERRRPTLVWIIEIVVVRLPHPRLAATEYLDQINILEPMRSVEKRTRSPPYA